MKICTECKHYMNVYLECARKKKGIDSHNGRQRFACVLGERRTLNIFWWMCGPKGRFWEAG